MGELFGTDGIRGKANQYPLDCETALKAGRAVAAFFDETPAEDARFLIGCDTRISGRMLASALAAGICAMGKDVWLAGVIPTPGVARLTAAGGFDAGIVISASHNPYDDNGIKLFNKDGFKLADDDEAAIERLILDDGDLIDRCASIRKTGSVHRLTDSRERYADFLAQCMAGGLDGTRLVLDCSNGAASEIAPALFRRLGAAVTPIFCEPDGININADCGSQHPEALADRVLAEKADLGLAFDGDADRLIAVDETGRILSGDQIMAILAKTMQASGDLTPPIVVTTVMSNLGFGEAMASLGVQHLKAAVGDRHVMAEMVKSGAVLGGEDSGHMIFLDRHTTGDGMLAALMLMSAVRQSGKPLSQLATVMTVFPQCLINVEVHSKPPLDSIVAVTQAIENAEHRLGESGRVLVRYSGTQPQCRVMVEGPTEPETREWCRQIASAVEAALG